MDTENVTMLPDWSEPASVGEALADDITVASRAMIDAQRRHEKASARFAIWDSLPDDIKCKLDQLFEYKPITPCVSES